MLATAKDILLSEMVLAEGIDHDILNSKIDEIIKESYTAGIVAEASSAAGITTTT